MLTDEEIQKLAVEVSNNISLNIHGNCTFKDINPNDLEEAVKFYKNFNSMMEDGKRTMLKTIISLSITGLFVLIAAGTVSKFKDM